MRFYDLTADVSTRTELGGFEWEIVLTKRPATPSITLSLDMRGLIAYLQPRRTTLRGEPFTMPEDVVGSYAFYHATRGNVHAEPGAADKYRTGKAFHLYRPEAIDALGRRTWGTLTLDQPAGVTISLDAAWLAAATYPVVIDPTVGYTSIGASEDSGVGDIILGMRFAAPSAGDANPGTAFVYGRTDASTLVGMVGSYADGDANPGGNAAVHTTPAAITLTTTVGWRSAAITWTSITAINYWLALNGQGSGFHINFDDVDVDMHYAARTHANDMPATFPAAPTENPGGYKPSLYVDYAAAGGGITYSQLEHAIKRGSFRGAFLGVR